MVITNSSKNTDLERFVLIDTFNFLHRAFHALPITLTDSEGSPTNAVYGVTSMLISVFDALKPAYVVAAMESREPLLRSEEYEEYKAHRKPMDENLAVQIPKVLEILDAFGVNQVVSQGYEADDVIATLATSYSKDLEIIIVSNDRDLWQLVGDNVLVMAPVKGGQIEWIGPEQVQKRNGFSPKQIADYKALRGDPSDNIKGVAGIGEKTATNLIAEFGDLDNIYSNLDKVEPESVRKKLESSKEDAFLSKKLAMLECDVPLNFDLEASKYTEFNKGRVKDALVKYNFKSLIKRLGFDAPRKQKTEEVSENQLPLI